MRRNQQKKFYIKMKKILKIIIH